MKVESAVDVQSEKDPIAVNNDISFLQHFP